MAEKAETCNRIATLLYLLVIKMFLVCMYIYIYIYVCMCIYICVCVCLYRVFHDYREVIS